MSEVSPVNIVIGILIGFFAGFCFSKRGSLKPQKASKNDDSVGDNSDEELAFGDYSDEYKMVFVVRQDLKMGKGKSAAQCCHAAVDIFKKSKKHHPEWLASWESIGCAKVALKCPDEYTLLALAAHARIIGLDHSVISDAGRTQIAPGSRTVLGIGPAPVDLIDKVTGHLKLL